LRAAAAIVTAAEAFRSANLLLSRAGVLPMDADRVLPRQTVLVENGRIAAIGSSIEVPKKNRSGGRPCTFLQRSRKDAGLSRHQVLAAATPGEMVHRAVGRRADLVLSQGNPLDDLSTLRKPLGVMANGRWYAQADFQALLDDLAGKYGDVLAPK
jgi:imidazolonepropionase-like amidohydrolase